MAALAQSPTGSTTVGRSTGARIAGMKLPPRRDDTQAAVFSRGLY